jgi:protein RecA
MIVKNSIKMGKDVFYCEPENMLDLKYAYSIVGEEDWKKHVTYVMPDTAEHTFTLMTEAISSGNFGLVILDSTGALTPKAEKDRSDYEKREMMLVPQLMAKFLRISRHDWVANNVALVFVSQIRDKVGVFSHVKLYELPGGHALKHYPSVIVWLSKSLQIKNKKVAIGQSIKFVVKKNKVSAPFRGYVFDLMFNDGQFGINEYADILDFAVTSGVITKSGPFYKYKDTSIAKGAKATIEYLIEHPDFVAMIREDVLAGVDQLAFVDDEEESEESELEAEEIES